MVMFSTEWEQATGLPLGVSRNGMQSSVQVWMLGVGEGLSGRTFWFGGSFLTQSSCPHPLHELTWLPLN